VKNSATPEETDREASNELFSRDFSDEKHANTVEDRSPQRVRSSWFGGLLRWRARTSCHTGCARNAFANSHPVSTFCAGPHSAPVNRYSRRFVIECRRDDIHSARLRDSPAQG